MRRGWFWPLRAPEGDPIPEDGPAGAAIRPASDRPRRRVVCEFCECELTHGGEYITLSERAKKFRKLADDNEQLREKLAEAESERDTLRREAAARAAADAPKKSGLFT